MVKLKYIGKGGLTIPTLKSKGGTGLKLPLMDYNKNKPSENQVFEVSENEGNDLLRCWAGSFEVVKEAKKAKEPIKIIEEVTVL